MRTMRYTTHTGEAYTIEPTDDDAYVVHQVGRRSRKVKRTFHLTPMANRLVCDGRSCKKRTDVCVHAKMIYTLTERPMPNDNVISLIARQATQLPLPLPDPVAQAATELREVLADFGMQLKIWYRTMEGLAERLVLVARDEARPRILYESMNVLEGHMPLMRRQSMQCLRCIRHSSCVASDRQGMKCLAYFLTLDYQNEFDFYRCIPLTIDALNMVDFHTLLLLCVIHQVNFDVIDQFTLVNLRAHLILCVGHLDTAS